MIFDAMRPLILTGIEGVTTRPDLLDRSIVLHLEPIPEDRRRPEGQLYAAFDAASPRILGALLTVVSHAIRELPKTQLSTLPRMADFCLWVTAAEPALGWAGGSFVSTYGSNQSESNDLALDASPVAGALMQLAASAPWQGTAAELLVRLSELVTEQIKDNRSWPHTPRALSGALRRLAPNLRRAGVEVRMWREPGGNRRRMLEVKKTGGQDRPHRPSVNESPANPPPVGDGRGAQGDGSGTNGGPVPGRESMSVWDGWDGRDAKSAPPPNSQSRRRLII
jgi:hypothetical protein